MKSSKYSLYIFSGLLIICSLFSLLLIEAFAVTWQDKVDFDLQDLIPNLPQSYQDFVTKEAPSCTLSIREGTLEPGTVALARHYLISDTWEVIVGELSTWESVNIENLVHELTHAGANGTGTDSYDYNQNGEVNSRKKEAESWKNAASKPSRDSGQDQGCWATYDMVFNSSGTQRSHDEIKKKLKTFGYAQNKM